MRVFHIAIFFCSLTVVTSNSELCAVLYDNWGFKINVGVQDIHDNNRVYKQISAIEVMPNCNLTGYKSEANKDNLVIHIGPICSEQSYITKLMAEDNTLITKIDCQCGENICNQDKKTTEIDNASGNRDEGTGKDKSGNTNAKILITFGVIVVIISFLCIHENRFFY